MFPIYYLEIDNIYLPRTESNFSVAQVKSCILKKMDLENSVISPTLTTQDLWIRRCDNVPTLVWFWKEQKRRAAPFGGKEDISITVYWVGSRCVGAGLNPIKQPNMFWLQKVLILHSDKLNSIEGKCIRNRKPVPTRIFMHFFPNLQKERFKSYCRDYSLGSHPRVLTVNLTTALCAYVSDCVEGGEPCEGL